MTGVGLRTVLRIIKTLEDSGNLSTACTKLIMMEIMAVGIFSETFLSIIYIIKEHNINLIITIFAAASNDL